MKILLVCEHFHPLGGGVSKTLVEYGARLHQFGHEISVATSYTSQRTSDEYLGMKIYSFKVSGNAVSGMTGEVGDYQQFLKSGNFDCLFVVAAQQWTLDAMLPILDSIPYKKYHMPCGYSSFYLPAFRDYYRDMGLLLSKFQALIYNSSNYRDINYARELGLKNIHIIPAAASELEFEQRPAPTTKKQLQIKQDEFVFLTVGAPAYHKGQKEAVQAYLKAKLPFPSVLVANGDYELAAETWVQVLKKMTSLRKIRSVAKELAQRFLGISPANIYQIAKRNRDPNKRVLFTNLDRPALISLFFEANLFLFPSHVEYSPLVIFESMAANLPFLSVPAGNVDEIVEWSHGGFLCTDVRKKNGRTYVNVASFTSMLEEIAKNPAKLKTAGDNGRRAWQQRFTWQITSRQLEAVMKANQ